MQHPKWNIAASAPAGRRPFSVLFALAFIAFSLLQARLPAQQTQFEGVRQLLDEGRFVSALQQARAAEATMRASAPAEIDYWLGRCYMGLVKPDSALICLNRAFSAIPTQDSRLRCEIENYLGAALSAKGQYDRALIHIQSAVNWCEANRAEAGDLPAQCYFVLGTWHLRKSDFQPALAAFQQSLALQQDHNTMFAGQSLMYIGYIYWKRENASYEQALAYFKQAEQICMTSGGAENNILAALYGNMCGCYNEFGDPRAAGNLCQQALELFTAQDEALSQLTGRRESNPNLPSIYNNLGNSYSSLGEYASAIRYLEKVVQLRPKTGKYWNNLGNAYLNIGNLTQAEHCFHESLKLLLDPNNKQLDSAEIARPYHNLGLVFKEKGDLDKALEYEFKSLPYRKTEGDSSLDVARTYMGIGKCFLAKKDFSNAVHYLDTALRIQHRVLPAGLHDEIVTAYSAKAGCLVGLANFSGAFALLDSALVAGGYRESDFAYVLSPLGVLTALEQKGTFLYLLYQKSGDERHLLQSERAYQTAATAAGYFRTTLLESESKATFSAQFRDILNGGIDAAFELHRLHPESTGHAQLAFALAEQSRSLILLEGVRTSGAQKFEGMSDSLLGHERTLQQAITDAELKLKSALAKRLAPDDSRLAQLRDDLFRQHRAYESFQRNLLADGHSNYYNYKYGFALATPDDVRNNLLDTAQGLLEYFIGDSSIYLFLIKKDDYRLVEIKKDFPLEEWVKQLRHGICGYHSADLAMKSGNLKDAANDGMAQVDGLPAKTDGLRDSTTDEYIQSAMALYQKLLAPVDTLLPRRVVIVPDGALGYIPFEALLTAKPKQKGRFHEYPYFGKQEGREHSISYCYSATMLREMATRQHRQTPAHPFLAYAPYFDGDTTLLASRYIDLSNPANRLPPLKYAAEEVEALYGLMGGKAVIGRSARKDSLVQEAGRYRIVHLSTHGKADDKLGDYSFLAFSEVKDSLENEWLYVRDIYNLSLNADMVVLSACETGIGELKRGEGIISLARAFAYAGAKSIVTTLWSVDDAKTKDFMVFFYRNLKQGMAKDEALAKARSDYFAAHDGLDAHPFFWAGFVGIGDMGALR